MGLSHQVLEFEEVCLETVILSSTNLSQGLEFISGRFICMVWIEHVSKCFLYVVQVLSAALMFASVRICNQVSAKYFPCPLPILLSKVTDLTSSVVKVEGLTWKYASMAFTHRIASLVSPEKTSGRVSLTVLVLVVVDIGFAGGGIGLAGGWARETVDKGAKMDGMVVGTTEDTVVIKGMTGGNGLVTGILGWKPEGGSGVVRLGGEGSDAGLTVY